jgi:hypothetical protein
MLLPSSLHDDMVSGAFAVLCFGFRWLDKQRNVSQSCGVPNRVAGAKQMSMLLKCCCGTAAACRYQNDQEERTGTHRYHGETEGWRMDLSKI